MIVFFLIDGLLLLFSLAAVAALRNQLLLNRAIHGAIIAAMVSGLIFTVQAFSSVMPFDTPLYLHPELGSIALHFDALSLFFLGIIQIGGIIVSINGIGELTPYAYHRSLKPTIIATVLLFFSMQLVVVAAHAFLFLVAWEVMALSGYLAIMLERETKDVQQGSLIFFVATHVGTLFLYIMFMLLHWQTGSWEFNKFSIPSSLPELISSVFWTGFIGFGMKAGFMPLHFWKPEAYPVAPTHISAALSAIMPKMGIYGLIRLILWIQPIDHFYASTLLAISGGTAVMGIWNALTQKDLKRMLAYSSVENIGIIGLSLSVLMFGIAFQQPFVIFLGLSGTLFQTLNHFVFKSLLFMSAGTIQRYYQHRNIEQMGGLMKSSPAFGGIVLLASLAISGLPPLNGFASEFLIFSSFFEAANVLQGYFPFFMLIAAVTLAFVGGLAVVAFSKNFSMVFLGREKSTVTGPVQTTTPEFISFLLLSMLILLLGIFPEWIIGMCVTIFTGLFPAEKVLSLETTVGTMHTVGLIAAAVLVIIAVLVVWKNSLAVQHSTRISLPWGCGYSAQSARMQYSGTSFSDTIVNIAGKALIAENEVSSSETMFPLPGWFRTNVQDFILYKIVRPTTDGMAWFTSQFKWLQSSQIQIYVTFSIVVLVFYLYLAFYL
ncbi:MAG: proton-conducting transporter membrane subunit [Bacteroidota bacterium]